MPTSVTDLSGNAAATLTGQAVTNITNAIDPIPPDSGSTVALVSATMFASTVTLTLNQIIASGVVPPTEFMVMAEGGVVPVTSAYSGGATVTLALDLPVNYAAPVSVLYFGTTMADLDRIPVGTFGPTLINNSTANVGSGGFTGGLPNKIAARLVQRSG